MSHRNYLFLLLIFLRFHKACLSVNQWVDSGIFSLSSPGDHTFFQNLSNTAFKMGAVNKKWFKADDFFIKPMTPLLTFRPLFSCFIIAWSDSIDVNGISLLLTLKLSLRYSRVWRSFSFISIICARYHASIIQLVMCKEVFCEIVDWTKMQLP